MIRPARMLLVIAAGASVAALLAEAQRDVLPKRIDCIAGVELVWKAGATANDRVAILNRIADTRSATDKFPIGGRRTHGTDRIYFIFTHYCHLKEEMTSEILEVYREQIARFPDYLPIRKAIEPSPQTIEVYGEFWSDGQLPPGLLN